MKKNTIRTLIISLATAALLPLVAASAPAVVKHVFPENVAIDRAYIDNSPGGDVQAFLDVREDLRSRDTKVFISGDCASACTLFLDLPNACVYANTRLGFHMPFYFWNGVMRAYTYADAESFLELYPEPIRKWIKSKGGLKPDIMWLTGDEMLKIVPRCEGAPLKD